MGASISANQGSHCFINSKTGDSHPTHNSNPTCTHTYIQPPASTTCWTSNRPTRAHYFLLALPLPCSNRNSINTPHNPSTDIFHSPAYEDGTDSEFRTQTLGNYPKRNKLYICNIALSSEGLNSNLASKTQGILT